MSERNNNSRVKNILFVQTPFQIKVALSVIDYHNVNNISSLGDWFVVITTGDTSARFKYYCSKLDELDVSTTKVEVLGSLSYAETLKGIISSLPIASNVFVASVDSPLVLGYLERLSSNDNLSFSLSTFDEGTSSILKSGIYNLPIIDDYDYKPFIYPNWDSGQVLRDSVCHYSILACENNLLSLYNPSIEFIQLLKSGTPLQVQTRGGLKPFIKVFIGQELQTRLDSREYTTNICKKLGIDLYIPHPRVPITGIEGVEVLDTDNLTLLAEDYITGVLLQEYERVEVYHFYSSTALLLNGISDRVSVTGIYVSAPYISSIQKELKDLGLTYKLLPVRITQR